MFFFFHRSSWKPFLFHATAKYRHSKLHAKRAPSTESSWQVTRIGEDSTDRRSASWDMTLQKSNSCLVLSSTGLHQRELALRGLGRSDGMPAVERRRPCAKRDASREQTLFRVCFVRKLLCTYVFLGAMVSFGELKGSSVYCTVLREWIYCRPAAAHRPQSDADTRSNMSVWNLSRAPRRVSVFWDSSQCLGGACGG